MLRRTAIVSTDEFHENVEQEEQEEQEYTFVRGATVAVVQPMPGVPEQDQLQTRNRMKLFMFDSEKNCNNQN
jgi:hypothetical protein